MENSLFCNKDLVKYLVVFGLVYSILKMIPNQQLSNKDLVLVMIIITLGFICIDCIFFKNHESFANIKKRSRDIETDDDDYDYDCDDDEEDCDDDYEDDYYLRDNRRRRKDYSRPTSPSGSPRPTRSGKPSSSESPRPTRSCKPSSSESTRPTRSGSPTRSESPRPTRSGSPRPTRSGSPTRSESPIPTKAGRPTKGESKNRSKGESKSVSMCGPEIEKMKKKLESEVKELKRQMMLKATMPDKENSSITQKYFDSLILELNSKGILRSDEIDNIKLKISSKLLTMEEAIVSLENLKKTGKPEIKETNDFKYNELPDEFYNPIGNRIANEWANDNEYNLLNTNKWQVPMPRPPVCINTAPCKVCPSDGTNFLPVNLKNWDEARTISDTTINQKWAKDKKDSTRKL